MWCEGGVARAFAPSFPTIPPSPAAICGTHHFVGVPLPSTASIFMHGCISHCWHVIELPFPFLLCFALLDDV